MKTTDKYSQIRKMTKKIGLYALTLASGFLLMNTTAFAQQVSPGVSPMQPPATGFGIDGDLIAKTPNNAMFMNSGDWLPAPNGLGGVLYGPGVIGHAAGSPLDTAITYHSIDTYSSGDDIYNGGQKKNDNPNLMSWKRGNPSPAKNDINNFMVHIAKDADMDTWIVVSGDREVVSGNSFLSLQFLQKTLTQQPNNNLSTPGGTFQSAGTDGGRTEGDLQVSAEFINGGGNPNLYLERWEPVAGGGFKWVAYNFFEEHPEAAYGAVNAGILNNVPYDAFGGSSYQPNAFMEVAINITEIIDAVGGDQCLGRISTLWPMTKSSQSESANMTDFVTPLQINLTINAEVITADPAALCGGSYDLLNAITSDTAGLTFEYYNAYPGPGVNPLSTSIVSQTGTYYVKAANNTNTLCNTIDTVNVTINAIPSAPTTAPVSYCTGETAAQLSATGSNLLWYDSATDTTGSATAPTPSTATAGTTTYYVTQTVNGCESAQASLVVTIKARPAAPTVAPVAYCKDATAAQLTATGANLLWYTAATGGTGSTTAPTPSTGTVGTTTYYVSQTVDGCEGARAGLVVTINALLPEPTLLTVNPTCSTSTGTIRVINPKNNDNANPQYHFSFDNGTTYDTVSIYEFQAGGGYSVRVKNLATGCESADATCTAEEQAKTANSGNSGFGSINPESQLMAYPIPFTDKVTVEFTSSRREHYVINLYDIRGSLIKQLKAGEANAGEIIRIEVEGSNLSDSMYLARKVSKSGISTIKLLKKE